MQNKINIKNTHTEWRKVSLHIARKQSTSLNQRQLDWAKSDLQSNSEWGRQFGSHTVSAWIAGTGHNRSKSWTLKLQASKTSLYRPGSLTWLYCSMKLDFHSWGSVFNLCADWNVHFYKMQNLGTIIIVITVPHLNSLTVYNGPLLLWPFTSLTTAIQMQHSHKIMLPLCPKFSALLRHGR